MTSLQSFKRLFGCLRRQKQREQSVATMQHSENLTREEIESLYHNMEQARAAAQQEVVNFRQDVGKSRAIQADMVEAIDHYCTVKDQYYTAYATYMNNSQPRRGHNFQTASAANMNDLRTYPVDATS